MTTPNEPGSSQCYNILQEIAPNLFQIVHSAYGTVTDAMTAIGLATTLTGRVAIEPYQGVVLQVPLDILPSVAS